MGRIANKKTGKLNKAYRDPSMYHNVRSGRKTSLLKTTTKKKNNSAKSYVTNNVEIQNVSPKEMKFGCLTIIILLALIVAFISLLINADKKREASMVSISLEELQSSNHPKAADEKDSIKAYYNGVKGVEFDHLSDFEYEYEGALVWYYSSQYEDNSLNDILIDFSKLSEKDQEQLTFEKVLDVAMSFVPVAEILEYYTFDKAIYVEREDHIAHELYYKENEEKVANMPTKYYQNHGFSVVIKEYNDGKFTAAIETSWYDYEYDRDSVFNSHITQEELDAHQKWDFSLENYIKQ